MLSLEQGNLEAIVQRARQGDAIAIAYWLNLYLLPQGCCAKVTPTGIGTIQVIVLCRQLPDRPALLTALRDRLLRLGAPRYHADIIAKLANQNPLTLWQYRLVFATPPVTAPPPPAPPAWIAQLSHTYTSALAALRGTLAPTTRDGVALYPVATAGSSNRRLWLGGSAALAFFLGCGFELVQHQTHALSSSSGDGMGTLPLPGNLGRSHPETAGTVDAALETVPVVVHPVDHRNPTLTLSFSGTPWIPTGIDPRQPFPAADLALTYLDLPDDESPWETPEPWLERGSDVVSLPTLPSDERSRRSTLQRIQAAAEQAGLRTVGHGPTPRAARRPEILDVNGKRIAYLSYTSSGTSTSDDLTAQITVDVTAIRPQVDWVVVNFHWQDILADYPSAQQMDLAHHAVDQGSDLVIGYHPQVLQGAEIYRGRAIAYSIGNFMPEAETTASYDTAMLKVSLRQEQMRLEFVPVVVEAGKPRLADQAEAEQIQTYLDQASGLFAEPLRSPTVLDRRIPQAEEAPPVLKDTPAPEAWQYDAPPSEIDPHENGDRPADPAESFTTFPLSNMPERMDMGPVDATTVQETGDRIE
jgi:hypothetical protein